MIHLELWLTFIVLLLQEEAIIPMREDKFEHLGKRHGKVIVLHLGYC